MEALGFDVREDAMLRTLTDDAVKTSEIEGETLDREQVRSSLARRLGLESGGLAVVDKQADAIVAVVLDATQRFTEPLTADRLFAWHRTLFADKRPYGPRLRVGVWRDDANGPMQVVSGPIGRERVHFEAPPAYRVPEEMATFLEWFERRDPTVDSVLKAAIAHIWFVTVHPFEDGNGRLGRAVADLCLARSEGTGQRFYSLSTTLRNERASYYETLEATQKGGLDITDRLRWFLSVLEKALTAADLSIEATLRRARVMSRANTMPLNERQRTMLLRLLDDFVGKLTSTKWATMMKCSQDTAARDIESLVRAGLIAKGPGGGRSTSYLLID